MKLINLDIKNKIIFFVGSSAFLIFGLIFFGFVSMMVQVRDSYSIFLTKKQEVASLLEAGSTALVLKKQVEVLDSKLEDLNQSLIRKGNEIDFIQFFEALAQRHRMEQTINLSNNNTGVKNQSFQQAPLLLQLEGSFLDFMSYLIDLEASPYYINILSTEIKTKNIGSRNTWDLTSGTVVGGVGRLIKNGNLDEAGELPEDIEKSTQSLTPLVIRLTAQVFLQNK